MNHPNRPLLAAITFSLVQALVGCVVAGPVTPPAHPAEITIDIAPDAVRAGDETTVTLRLEPMKGIKINRYPKTRLVVSADGGVVAAGEASVGSDAPPPPDKLASNYFDRFDPLTLTLKVADGTTSGSHEVEAALTYFYCMPASGFCAPKKEKVVIPITVR